MPEKELAGKVALITGAAKNIGRATALELARAGATVAVNTRHSVQEALEVVKSIQEAGGRAQCFVADIADASAAKAMVAQIGQQLGRLDYLILNASVRTEKPFLELTVEEWRLPLSISLDGAFYLTQAAIALMLEKGGGSIVTLGGMMSLSGAKNRIHGSVAKHGLVGLTRGIAREFGSRGIRANCIAPGQMNTARASGRAERTGDSAIPMGRKGEPEEIATVIRFLCGEGASYLNGQTIQVNGGQMMF
jgi:3-oxoacyl-[acyl-carrier protein] reductase